LPRKDRKKKVQRTRNEIELCSIRTIIGLLCDSCIARGKGEEKGEAGERQTKKRGERSLSESLSCLSPSTYSIGFFIKVCRLTT
jgi:hypothetical protein